MFIRSISSLVTLATLATGQSIHLEGHRAGALNAQPKAVALGDFDGDGRLDVAAADDGGDTLQLAWNLGDAELSPPISLATGDRPLGLVAADIDGDGDVDLASANQGAATVSFLRNQGGGAFAPPVDFAVALSPTGIAAGDVDGDGDVDLVVACNSAFSMLRNQGGGTFAPRVDTPFGAAVGAWAVALGDLDGDGDLDAAVALRWTNQVAILVNDGSGVFTVLGVHGPVPSPQGIVLADMDQDGDLDVVAPGETATAGSFHVFTNDGTGNLSVPIAFPTIEHPICVAGGDLDGDGDVDLVFGSWQSYRCAIHTHGSGLAFTRTDAPLGHTAWGVALGDMDQDGDADIVGTNTYGYGISVLRNSRGQFTGQRDLPSVRNPSEVRAGDLDGDGDLDLVAVSRVDGAISVFLADSSGFAPEVRFLVGADAGSVAVGDLDADGDLDLAVVLRASGTTPLGSVQLMMNAGNGTFTAGATIPVNEYPFEVEAGDLDNDGDDDLVVSRVNSGHYAVLRSQGGNWVATDVHSANGDHALGDLDGDGDLDLLVSFIGGIKPYWNDGTGQFTVGPTWGSGVAYGRVALGDVDGDGDLDAAVGSVQGLPGRLSVVWNAGNGTFPTLAQVATERGPTSLAFLDADGDGDLDVAVGHAGSANVSVVENLGGQVLARAGDFGVVVTCSSLATGDFDSDGDEDVAAAAGGDAYVAILRNSAVGGQSVCAGDGSGAACPCGNASPPGSGAGCVNSFGTAGTLRGSGATSLANDGLTLIGTQMTNGSALYFQGTAAAAAGLGSAFGDGLRCAGGTVVRLVARANVGGASSYPAPGEPRVSVSGAVLAPGSRYYQAWYRNVAGFCTPSAFNLTNGWRIDWGP